MLSRQYLAISAPPDVLECPRTGWRNGLSWVSTGAVSALACLLAGLAVGGLLARQPPAQSALMAGAVAALVLAIYHPKLAGGLLVVGFLLVYEPGAARGGSVWPLIDRSLAQGLPAGTWSFLLLCVGTYAFRRILIEGGTPVVSLRPMVLYAAILSVAYVTGRIADWNRDTLRTDLFNMIYPFLAFYLIRDLFRRPDDARRLLRALFAGATLLATVLSAAYLTGHGENFVLSSGYRAGRLVTLDSAALMCFGAMLLLAAARCAQPETPPRRRICLALCAAPMAFALVFSFRRTEWLGIAAGLGLLWWLAVRDERRRLFYSGLLVLLIAVAAVVVAGGNELAEMLHYRGSTLVDPDHNPNRHHLYEPLQVLRELKERPLQGMGLGGEHGPIPEFPRDTVPKHVVHNTWIYVWMKLGLAGLLFLAWMTLRYTQALRNRLRSGLPAASRAELLALCAVVPMWLAQSMTAPIFWYPRQTSLVAVLAALALSMLHAEAPAKDGGPTTGMGLRRKLACGS